MIAWMFLGPGARAWLDVAGDSCPDWRGERGMRGVLRLHRFAMGGLGWVGEWEWEVPTRIWGHDQNG